MLSLRLYLGFSNPKRLSIWLLSGVLLVASSIDAKENPLSAAEKVAEFRREVTANFDALLQLNVQESNGYASGAVLVARDGAVLLSKGFGYANLEWKIPNTPSSRIHLASVTKSFTAIAAMQLREKGLLDLQDSVCKYLSPCPLAWQSVTLHHLLSQTSGISSSRRREDPWLAIFLSPIEHAAHIFNEPLEFAPGTKFTYSNINYILLGLILEKVTGKSYERIIKDQIFEPLGMRDSGYDRPEAVIERRATGYEDATTTATLSVNAKTGLLNARNLERFSSGGLYSTVEDLYKLDQALYSTVLLSRESLDRMWMSVAETDNPKGTYGYGWWLWSEAYTKGHRAIVGWGDGPGFHCILLRLPDEHTTIIVLANMPWHINPLKLRNSLFDANPRREE